MTAKFAAKGTHIIKASEWVDQKLGAGTFQRLAKKAGAGSEWTTPIAPLWYSVPVLCNVLGYAARELGQSLEEVCCGVARLNARDDLRTVYRFFMSVLGPVAVLKRSEQMYQTYVNFGQAKVLQNEPGLHVGQVSGIPRELVPWLAGVSQGFLGTAIEAAGGKNVVAKTAEPQQDPETGLYTVTTTLHYLTSGMTQAA